MLDILVISNKVDPITSIHLAKSGWKYGAGAGVLKKRGEWHLSYLIFQGLSFLYSEITLDFAKLCYVFEGRFFSATIIL